MFDIFRRHSCVAAAKLLEENAKLSREIRDALSTAVEDVTTVFDRREHPQPVPMERRKTG